MTTFKKTYCFSLRHKWELSEIILKAYPSSMFLKIVTYQEEEIFRVVLKKHTSSYFPNLATLFFINTNFKKMGLKVVRVSFTTKSKPRNSNDREVSEMEEENLETGANKEEIGAIQLFKADTGDVSNGRFTKYAFTFTVCLSGTVENYRLHQRDSLLYKNLCWSSLTNQDETDVKLIPKDGENFSAHKFILAARSPVFAALFSNKEVEHVYMDCNDDKLEQFINFIYVGEFHGLACKELLELALKYELKTLESLVKGAFKVTSTQMIAVLDDHLKPGPYEKYGENK